MMNCKKHGLMAGMLTLGLFLDEQSYREIEAYCAEHPTQCDSDETDAIVSSSARAESEPVRQQPYWWDRADLDAQRKMARWTTIIAIFTGGGVVLLAWTLWETRRVTVETRRIGEAQNGQSPAYDISGRLNVGWQPLLRDADTGQIEWRNEFEKTQQAKIRIPSTEQMPPLSATGNSIATITIRQP